MSTANSLRYIRATEIAGILSIIIFVYLMNNVLSNILLKVVELLLLTLSYSAIISLSSFTLLVPFHGGHLRVSWSSNLVINALV